MWRMMRRLAKKNWVRIYQNRIDIKKYGEKEQALPERRFIPYDVQIDKVYQQINAIFIDEGNRREEFDG